MNGKREQLAEAFLKQDMKYIAEFMKGIVCCGGCPAMIFCLEHRQEIGNCKGILEEWLETDDEPTYVEE